ncbi:flagellar hook-associated protein 3 [Vibrio sp. 10N.286.49.B3]|uniref:flagellar hook-associated protein FlgL n=1 Tax=Vibrio sp. 10N.286.49.B3 TaxID=1880855 RepID=UPI000C855D32|nr:flagellar hook-associated protein FlgL [Vibrio sp. 10N.286.49.B3]PMH40987.1 flagellar hook-associated protein 3 [Vibrio sp. 10N.286.49.B3]
MLTRVSSFHNYQSVQNDLRRQEGKVHHNQAQLASGKQLQSPSDNPLATHYLQNIGQQAQEINQYIDTITLTRNRLEHHEVMIDNSENFIDEAKRGVMEMINGALSPEDRLAKAREINEIENNLLNMVNSRDESGNYTFAGTKSKTQPFFRDSTGSVAYSGDNYQRKMRIANHVDMPINDPGNRLFMEIPNPLGDYAPSYDLQPASELLVEQATNQNSDDISTYKVTFVDMANGQFGYQLERNDIIVQAEEFDPQSGIEYQGLNIQLKGPITKGDAITLEPSNTFSLFDSMKNAQEWAGYSVSDSSATAHLHQVTEELHAAYIHLNQARTETGVRLKSLDTHEDQHEDFKFSLEKSKSSFEDLDYSKAIIDFNENSRALQASQQAFGKTKDLTLFNYI